MLYTSIVVLYDETLTPSVGYIYTPIRVFSGESLYVPPAESGDTPIVKISNQFLSAPAGYSRGFVDDLPWPVDDLSMLYGADPAAAEGDVIEWQLETVAAGFDVTTNGDGTFELSADDDYTQQSFAYRLWRKAAAEWSESKTVTLLSVD